MVFYPKFISTFKQGVNVMDITQTPEFKGDPEEAESYIFEPELSSLIDFFEVQIKNLLFNRAMIETELSRMAARMTKMNEAEGRAARLVEEKERELQKEVASVSSSQLLESFVGFKKWQ